MQSPSVGIIGFGRFGRALAGLISETGAGSRVRAFDTVAENVPDNIRAASLEDLCRSSDILIVATPVDCMERVLKDMQPYLVPHRHIVIDVASVKVLPKKYMTAVLGATVPWVCTHPMFGPSNLSLGIRPLNVAVCPNAWHPKATRKISEFFQKMDCNVVEKEAEWHDKFMADTHGLTFFVAKGLFEMGMDMSKWQLAPPSAQSLACTTELVRVDASHLFTPVHTSNPFSADARKKFINALVAIDRNLVAETPADLPHVTLPSNNGPVTMHSPCTLR